MAETKPQTPRKQKAPAKSPEQRQQERRARFLKLAEKRVNNALKALNNVARCGNRQGYFYTDQEAERIANTLLDAATAVKDAFQPAAGGKTLFTL